MARERHEPRTTPGLRARGVIGRDPAYDAGVSDNPPDDPNNPFGQNPFGGVPIFSDLAKMFQNQGPLSWDAAQQFALGIATNGHPETNVDPVARIQIEQLARVAELQVANATGLDPA